MLEKIEKNLWDIWFLIPFSIWLWFNTLNSTFYCAGFGDYFFRNLLFWTVIVLSLREIFMLKKVSIPQLLGALIVLKMIILLLMNNRMNIVVLLYIIYCMRNTDYKKVLWVTFVVAGIALLYTVLSSQTGRIEDYVAVQSGNRVRHYLGFLYALYAPTIFLNISAIWIYLRQRKITWMELSAIIAGSVVLYLATNSRFAVLMNLLLVGLAFLLKTYDGFEKKWIYRILSFSFIACTLFSFYVTIKYNDQYTVWAKLNTLLNNRLYFGQESLHLYGIDPFPQAIHFVGGGLSASGAKSSAPYFYVDNFYIHYTQMYGTLFFSLLGFCITARLWINEKRKDLWLSALLSFFCIHGIVDDLLWPVYYNAFFMSATYLMNGQDIHHKLLQRVVRILVFATTACMVYFILYSLIHGVSLFQ